MAVKLNRQFVWISLVIASIDILFIWFNYRSDQTVLLETLTRKGEQVHAGYHMILNRVSTSMQQMATYVAHDQRVQMLFLQGRRAVEAEGGGKGGEQAAVIRQQLHDLVAESWRVMTQRYDIRQLHFHLAPGDVSFLRIHAPHKFGDDLSPVRHTIVEANTHLIPTKGFESGRVYSGIRGVVPVFSTENGQKIHVGALEAGTSFQGIVDTLKREMNLEVGVMMTMEHAKETMWPSFLEKFLKSHFRSGHFLVESATNPDIRQVLSQWETKKQPGECEESRLLRIHNKPIGAYCFELRDFKGTIDSSRPAVGAILVWYDVSREINELDKAFKQNVLFAIIGFLLIELFLMFFWSLGVRRLNLLIQEKTRSLSDAYNEVLEAKHMAEQANQAKSHFLAAMSHDIRTPMNAVLGMAELLEESKLSDEQHQYVRSINASGNVLLSLINDILDLSKIEAGQLQLENVDFNLHSLIQNTMAVFDAKAQHKGVELVWDCTFSEFCDFHGDPDRIQQILLNLLGNAIKFTKQGRVELSVSEAPGGQIRFSVMDTGIGIPSGKLDGIFEPFNQGNASTTQRFGGTGLGLSICRKLISAMQGRIWAEHAESGGSVFTFQVPLISRQVCASSEVTLPEIGDPLLDRSTDSAALSVLLVDDSPDNMLLMKAFLRNTHYQIATAEDGQQAVDHVKNGHFDVILMDIEMPVMDGFNATKAIRQWQREQEQKASWIIALTAHAMREVSEQALEAGCDLCLTKPIKKGRLFQELDSIMNK
ncbi:MAG: response regulator [Magnetococcales bacterium]|nr:response regulator [Magnetococcales bacterium]